MSSELEPTNRDALGAPSNIEEGTTLVGHGNEATPFTDKDSSANLNTPVQESSVEDQAQYLESTRPEESVTASASLDDSKITVTNKDAGNNLIEDEDEELEDSDDDFPESEDAPRGPLKGTVSGQKPKPRPK